MCYTKNIKRQIKHLERVNNMDAVAIRKQDNAYTIDDAMNILFSKLDEAIDDMENGRVQTIEDAWKEIDEI